MGKSGKMWKNKSKGASNKRAWLYSKPSNPSNSKDNKK